MNDDVTVGDVLRVVAGATLGVLLLISPGVVMGGLVWLTLWMEYGR